MSSPSLSLQRCTHIVRLHAERNIADGLRTVWRTEGIRGLYRGTYMALVGVSSGAVQFMAYEQLKNFAFARKKRKMLASGQMWREGGEKLVQPSLCTAEFASG